MSRFQLLFSKQWLLNEQLCLFRSDCHAFPILFIKGWIMCLLVEAHPWKCACIISPIWEQRNEFQWKNIIKMPPLCILPYTFACMISSGFQRPSWLGELLAMTSIAADEETRMVWHPRSYRRSVVEHKDRMLAFCFPAQPSLHPYMLLNYSDSVGWEDGNRAWTEDKAALTSVDWKEAKSRTRPNCPEKDEDSVEGPS